MAFDGMMMSQVKNELLLELKDAHVSQVHQPNRDELVIQFRSFKGNKKLLISTRADSPRVSITSYAPENPNTPPMLCMLLRKRLASAKLIDICQPENERILRFVFEAVNEIGDREKLTLCIEIMGKYSNVILIDKDDNVIDALKRVDMSMSRERLILPKMRYENPKGQDKIYLSEITLDTIIEKVYEKEYPLDKALLSVIQGISPIVCREIDFRVANGEDLKSVLSNIVDLLDTNNCTPTMIIREDNSPLDISFIDINQYGNSVKKKTYTSFSLLLDEFYKEREFQARMKAKTQSLNKMLSNIVERLSKKINLQRADLTRCKDREKLRIKADLLQANLYKVERGTKAVTVDNFYDENCAPLTIDLNPAISPAANAQKFYKAYAKAKTGEIKITEQINKSEDDLVYIESVQDLISRVESEKELSAIRQELIEQGYIKEQKGAKRKESSLPPIEYENNGFRILVGRNNKQNDLLTLKYARKNDLWFHTKDIPGSHVIIETNGRDVPEETIYMAAQVAALHSKARNSSNVPVDYTMIKNVSKPSGAKPGKVIYVNNKTQYVNPYIINNE